MLTSYNGNTITYDAIGNPLNWGTDISNMQWKNGRRLTYLQKRSNMISYAYDETGLRTRKSTNTNRTYFDRDASGNLVHEFRDYSGYLGEDSHLYYYYDANGSIGSISYNGVRYAFLKNLQGDVIAILDTNSNIVARYTYDAWGKVLSVTDANGNINTSSSFIGNVNPIRYRGYYYDTETGWYYLNSRYYDPDVKRFINEDDYASNGYEFIGTNMFAYCENNPVNRIDKFGHNSEKVITSGAFFVALASALAGGIPGIVFGLGGMAIVGTVLAVENADDNTSSEDNNEGEEASNAIDWDSVDGHHALLGSKTSREAHGPGWNKFGIDPNGNNAWDKLVPILKDTLRTGKFLERRGIQNGNGGSILYYGKDYVEEGVRVIVKIWTKGKTYRFSDAYTVLLP